MLSSLDRCEPCPNSLRWYRAGSQNTPWRKLDRHNTNEFPKNWLVWQLIIAWLGIWCRRIQPSLGSLWDDDICVTVESLGRHPILRVVLFHSKNEFILICQLTSSWKHSKMSSPYSFSYSLILSSVLSSLSSRVSELSKEVSLGWNIWAQRSRTVFLSISAASFSSDY